MHEPELPRPGNVDVVKVWYHLIAAVVGLCIAALIVYLVFGNASEEGATQDGDAGALAAAEGLCGTIDPADTTSEETRAVAGENNPALFDAQGPIPAIREDQVDQQAWVNRVTAAGGMCIDEIRIEQSGATNNLVTISMSTVDGVTDEQARAYAAGVIAQSFTPPFNPRTVTLQATVGDSQRSIVISDRAWRAYQVRRRQLKLQHTIENLVLFRQAVGRQFGADLRLNGWS